MPLNLISYLRDVPDFPKPGILFKDITPLLASPEALIVATSVLVLLQAAVLVRFWVLESL